MNIADIARQVEAITETHYRARILLQQDADLLRARVRVSEILTASLPSLRALYEACPMQEALDAYGATLEWLERIDSDISELLASYEGPLH